MSLFRGFQEFYRINIFAAGQGSSKIRSHLHCRKYHLVPKGHHYLHQDMVSVHLCKGQFFNFQPRQPISTSRYYLLVVWSYELCGSKLIIESSKSATYTEYKFRAGDRHSKHYGLPGNFLKGPINVSLLL